MGSSGMAAQATNLKLTFHISRPCLTCTSATGALCKAQGMGIEGNPPRWPPFPLSLPPFLLAEGSAGTYHPLVTLIAIWTATLEAAAFLDPQVPWFKL